MALVIVAVDGDTVDIDGVRWRLMGFDTPEITHARCAYERAIGRDARVALQSAINGARVAEPRRKRKSLDKFGRVLGELWIDGKNVADIMVENGYARRYNGRKRRGWCGINFIF